MEHSPAPGRIRVTIFYRQGKTHKGMAAGDRRLQFMPSGLACPLWPHPKETTDRQPRGKGSAITMFVFPFSGREEKPGLNFML